MNTGIQSSSSTPMGASTTTTPAGKLTPRKDLIAIAVAHGIPYAASASVANIPDLRRKVQKARDTEGPSLIHVHAPCPTGWGYPPAKSIEVCRAAINTGAWVLYEVEGGRTTINVKPKELRPVADYLNLQGRFKGVPADQVEQIQKSVRERYEALVDKSV